MAVRFSRTELTGHYESMITDLTFIPFKKFKKKTNPFAVTPPPKVMYFYHEDQYSMRVPYQYGCAKAGTPMNLQRDFQVLQTEFTGTLRENQVSVIDELMPMLAKHGTASLNLPPGMGKTVLGTYVSAALKLLTMVLLNRDPLVTQWITSISKNSNARIWVVDADHEPPPEFDIIICMYKRWQYIPEEIRDRVGLLIVDEAHMFCTTDCISALLCTEPKYILLETATPFRQNKMETMLHAMAGTHAVVRELELPNGYRVFTYPTYIVPERVMGSNGPNWTKMVQSTIYQPARNQAVYNHILANPNKTYMMLTLEKNHAYLMEKELTELQVECEAICGSKKVFHDKRVTIGTVAKTGTGFDQANACIDYRGRPFDVVIILCSFAFMGSIIQNVGRGFRTQNPVIIYFLDNDTIYERHYKEACKYFDKTGGHIITWCDQLADLVLEEELDENGEVVVYTNNTVVAERAPIVSNVVVGRRKKRVPVSKKNTAPALSMTALDLMRPSGVIPQQPLPPHMSNMAAAAAAPGVLMNFTAPTDAVPAAPVVLRPKKSVKLF